MTVAIFLILFGVALLLCSFSASYHAALKSESASILVNVFTLIIFSVYFVYILQYYLKDFSLLFGYISSLFP
jgi:hypothetical protein